MQIYLYWYTYGRYKVWYPITQYSLVFAIHYLQIYSAGAVVSPVENYYYPSKPCRIKILNSFLCTVLWWRLLKSIWINNYKVYICIFGWYITVSIIFQTYKICQTRYNILHFLAPLVAKTPHINKIYIFKNFLNGGVRAGIHTQTATQNVIMTFEINPAPPALNVTSWQRKFQSFWKGITTFLM